MAKSSPLSALQTFFVKLNEGYAKLNRKSSKQSLPDYASQGARGLMEEWIGGMDSQTDSKWLEVILDSCQGPLSTGAGTNDALVLKAFSQTQFNPWKSKKIKALLEMAIEQNWAQTLGWILKHPSKPANWDATPVFGHHIPLIHAVAMRKFEVLKAAMDAGANPGINHKGASILKRAASMEHFQLLLEDGRTHDSLKEYIASIAEERQRTDYFQKIPLILKAMTKSGTLSQAKDVFSPVIQQMVQNFPSNFKLWQMLNAVKSSHLPNDWLDFPKQSTKQGAFQDYAKWPILAGMAHRQFFKIRTEATSINTAYLAAMIQTPFDWVRPTPNQTSIPMGVWPALLIWGFPDGLNAYASSLSKPTTGVTLNRKQDIQEFLPFIGSKPHEFWTGVDEVLSQVDKSSHWAKGRVLSILLLEPLWKNLPGYTMHEASLKTQFREWFQSPWSKGISQDKTWAGFIQTYMYVLQEDMKQGLFQPNEDDLQSWMTMVKDGTLKPALGIDLLKTHSDIGGRVDWNDTWQGLYEALEKKLPKGKGGLQLKPELERWRLRNTLENSSQDTPKRMRL